MEVCTENFFCQSELSSWMEGTVAISELSDMMGQWNKCQCRSHRGYKCCFCNYLCSYQEKVIWLYWISQLVCEGLHRFLFSLYSSWEAWGKFQWEVEGEIQRYRDILDFKGWVTFNISTVRNIFKSLCVFISSSSFYSLEICVIYKLRCPCVLLRVLSSRN